MKIIKVCVAGILALVVLSGFVLLYEFRGIHIKNPSGSTDYKWVQNQFNSVMTEGFTWNRMDKNGFNNTEDSVSEHPDILLMGNSHLEGVEVAQNQTIAALLNKALPDLNVYSIGMPGHKIYHCGKNMKNAMAEYDPQDYVIVFTTRVFLSNENMKAVLDNTLPVLPSYDSGLLYYLQKTCPAIKSLYIQMDHWRKADNTDALESIDQEITVDYEVLSGFLKKMKDDCGDRRLMIVYMPETDIGSDGKMIEASLGVSEFSDACKENNILFINMMDDFRKLYEERHILAHGFINTRVGKGHLNKYGHEVVANRLAAEITDSQIEKAG